MKNKARPYVQIPADYVCIPLKKYSKIVRYVTRLDMATAKIVEDHSKYIENLNEIETKKLESDALAQELQAKVADLEKQLSEKQDRVLYWYNEHNKLQEKLNALASNAAQVNAVKPNAEAEKT